MRFSFGKKKVKPIVHYVGPGKKKKQKQHWIKDPKVNAQDLLIEAGIDKLIYLSAKTTAEKASLINQEIKSKLSMPLNQVPGFSSVHPTIKVGDFISKSMIKNLRKKDKVSDRAENRKGKSERKQKLKRDQKLNILGKRAQLQEQVDGDEKHRKKVEREHKKAKKRRKEEEREWRRRYRY